MIQIIKKPINLLAFLFYIALKMRMTKTFKICKNKLLQNVYFCKYFSLYNENSNYRYYLR